MNQKTWFMVVCGSCGKPVILASLPARDVAILCDECEALAEIERTELDDDSSEQR